MNCPLLQEICFIQNWYTVTKTTQYFWIIFPSSISMTWVGQVCTRAVVRLHLQDPRLCCRPRSSPWRPGWRSSAQETLPFYREELKVSFTSENSSSITTSKPNILFKFPYLTSRSMLCLSPPIYCFILDVLIALDFWISSPERAQWASSTCSTCWVML